MALILRNGGSQSPGRWLRDPRNNQPHHGSPRNISRELIKQIKSERFIISTNKRVDKVTLRRFLEERENTEFLLNYDWWSNGYFTNDDRKKYIDTNKIVMRYIGEEKIRV